MKKIIDRQRVMRMAHALYRTGHFKTWKDALRRAWLVEKAANTREERLDMLCFNHWAEHGFDRWYVNPTMLGFEVVQRYKSGNILFATLDGNTISNTAAREIENMKIFFDMKKDKFYVQGGRYQDEFLTKASTLWNAAA